MLRRNEILALGLLLTLSLLLLVLNQNKGAPRADFYDIDYTTNYTINEIVKLQTNAIRESLKEYPFDYNTFLERGQPIRSLIVTSWRSGSTFLGDVINSVPGNYYHYEPLLDYGIVQIRGPPYSETAVSNLRDLLNCDYSRLSNYLEYGRSHTYLFMHNVRLWGLCEAFPNFCWMPEFLAPVCKLFPFQSMKIVRIRLRLIEELLRDDTLNVKVLFMVRDPRGTMQSRRHRDWCPGEPDCDKPNLVCADMVSDYSAAIRLKKKYPDRFRAIRYEDLCLEPYGHIKSLFRFLGLHFHRTVREFLDSHTKRDVGGVSSTTRDTKSAPFHWRQDLNFSEVQYIEENCDQAMRLWGYLKANDTHLRDFHPLTNYTIR